MTILQFGVHPHVYSSVVSVYRKHWSLKRFMHELKYTYQTLKPKPTTGVVWSGHPRIHDHTYVFWLDDIHGRRWLHICKRANIQSTNFVHCTYSNTATFHLIQVAPTLDSAPSDTNIADMNECDSPHPVTRSRYAPLITLRINRSSTLWYLHNVKQKAQKSSHEP